MTTAAPDDSTRVALLLGVLFGIVGMANAGGALALGAVTREFDVGHGPATWSVTLYALVLGVGTAVYGRLADRHGYRWPLAVGVLLLAVGSVLSALAPSFPVLLVARAIQGAGAGAVPTLGMAVVSSRYTGAVRTSALVTLATVGIVSGAVGPFAIGVVLDLYGWRWSMVLPAVGLLLLLPLWKVLDGGAVGARLDVVGACLVAVTAAGVMLLIGSPATGAVVALAGTALVLTGVPLAVLWFRRRPDGFLPHAVTRTSVVVGPAAAASTLTAAWYALLVALPWELAAEGWSNVAIGLALVPGAAVGLLARGRLAVLGTRLGEGGALLAGMGIAACTLLLGAAGIAWHQPALLVSAGLFLPLAFSLGQPAMIALATDRVAVDVRGVAMGVATLLFMLGGSAGSAVVGGLGPAFGNALPLVVLAVLTIGGAALVSGRRGDGRAPVVPPA